MPTYPAPDSLTLFNSSYRATVSSPTWHSGHHFDLARNMIVCIRNVSPDAHWRTGESLDRLDSSQDSQLNIEASAAASHESYSVYFETWTCIQGGVAGRVHKRVYNTLAKMDFPDDHEVGDRIVMPHISSFVSVDVFLHSLFTKP